MIEAINSNRESASKSIIATSILAGALNAGLQTACEAVNVKKSKQIFRQTADEYLSKAIEMEKLGKKDISQFFLDIAQNAEKSIKNCKISWKNVGYGAAIGAVATAAICTALHAISSVFNKN